MLYIKGYLPRQNYQQILDDKILECLQRDAEIESVFRGYADRNIELSKNANFEKMFVKPPKYEEVKEPLPNYSKNSIKINYLEREQNNTKLGYLGEELVL